MAEADIRDAETVMAGIEAEFRMALKATRKFIDVKRSSGNDQQA